MLDAVIHNLLIATVGGPTLVFVSYVLARVVSIAHFRSRAEYDRNRFNTKRRT